MKKTFAKRFRLNLYDAIKAIGLFFLTNFGDLVYQALEMWLNDTSKPIDWHEMLKVSVVATVMYLIKNFFTTVPQQAIDHAKSKDSYTGKL